MIHPYLARIIFDTLTDGRPGVSLPWFGIRRGRGADNRTSRSNNRSWGCGYGGTRNAWYREWLDVSFVASAAGVRTSGAAVRWHGGRYKYHATHSMEVLCDDNEVLRTAQDRHGTGTAAHTSRIIMLRMNAIYIETKSGMDSGARLKDEQFARMRVARTREKTESVRENGRRCGAWPDDRSRWQWRLNDTLGLNQRGGCRFISSRANFMEVRCFAQIILAIGSGRKKQIGECRSKTQESLKECLD